MTAALVLFTLYIWAELVFIDNPSFRKFLVAPIAVPLVFVDFARKVEAAHGVEATKDGV